jgi:N-acetylmuramoyl-L-alanine amidase
MICTGDRLGTQIRAVLTIWVALAICLWPAEPDCQAPTGPLTVIIDPGHGGQDSGAKGPGDVLEKEVTLALARKLADVLEKQGTVRPVLTRSDDYFISLDDRAGAANHRGGDLLISLHLGNGFNTSPQGFTLYYWSPASAASTGSGSLAQGVSWEQGQFPYWERSRRLAEMLEKELLSALRWPSGGVVQADLYLLARVRMPAVLLELGSLASPVEAAELQKPAFQEIVTRAIAAAIENYGQMREGEIPGTEKNPQ